MKMEQSVSKSRHIKFRSRGITQKKTYNIDAVSEIVELGKKNENCVKTRYVLRQ
jgi:hypothetical protein